MQALGAASAAQRAVLAAHYGRHAPESVAAVKAVYAELGLAARFEAYEAAAHADLTARIEAVSRETGVPPAVFEKLLAKIFKRAK